MPLELYPPLILLLLVGIGACAWELRATLQPPSCPQCVHCRLLAAERKARAERSRVEQARRLWGIDDQDDEDRP